MCFLSTLFFFFFFFNDTATTEIYTLSLHDALPISLRLRPTLIRENEIELRHGMRLNATLRRDNIDRKSTRLNSSHLVISYAVFCLKKKKKKKQGYNPEQTSEHHCNAQVLLVSQCVH